jgi:hypothetical protein
MWLTKLFLEVGCHKLRAGDVIVFVPATEDASGTRTWTVAVDGL